MIKLSSPIAIKSQKTCVALGNFDGVHAGHRRIISTAAEHARNNGLLSCVYTFSTHPSSILGNRKPILTTANEKNKIFNKMNIDILYSDDFSAVRELSPREFCKKILKDQLNAKYVFCGSNYTFGYKGIGNTNVLRSLLNELDIFLIVVPYVYSSSNTVVSSTLIRKLISDGRVAEASELLLSYYTIQGIVMHGKQLGRKLGFPTLNISIPQEKSVPKFGVYISACILDGKCYNGISNIGLRPTTDTGTINERVINCETYLFDYSGDAYDKYIEVYLFDMIRSEMKFGNIDELKDQISKDQVIAEAFFSKNDPGFMINNLRNS